MTFFKVILHLDLVTAIVSSAAISVAYTLIGGMISVAYTDVFQLFFITFGLVRGYKQTFRCLKKSSSLYF